jgi:hypothetical protein
MSDGRSRKVFRTEAQWREIFTRQEASGLPAGEFCKGEGINPSVYFRWHRQLMGPTGPTKRRRRHAKPVTPFIDLGAVQDRAPAGGRALGRIEMRLDCGGGIQLTLVRS